MPRAIAVTIGVGKKWHMLATLAAASCRAMTGLPTHILDESAMLRHRVKAPHRLKFKLFQEFRDVDTILYFDADLIFLQQFDVDGLLNRSEFIAVRDRWDHGAVQQDAATIKINPREYFNSGLFVAARKHHALLLEKAQQLTACLTTSFHDQTHLNCARAALGIPCRFLPKQYNHLAFDLLDDPSQVVIGHFDLIDERSESSIPAYFEKWRERFAGRSTQIPWSATTVTQPPKMNRPTPDEIVRFANMQDEVLSRLVIPPPPATSGRGIVICGGGIKYFPGAWVCIRLLRQLGCTLPIELWYRGDQELSEEMARIVEPLGVVCINAFALRAKHPVRILNGWELKAYALLHSTFSEVLLLDSDNVPIRNPEYLFEDARYQRTGAVFWPDFGRLPRNHPIWDICRVEYRDEPEFESGQVLVDRARCWRELSLAMHFNEYSDFYFRFLHGDKECFHMAWRKTGAPYTMPARGIECIDATMCQHDLDGNRIFQHRNFDKWLLMGRNREIDGFEFESDCFAALEELRSRLHRLPNGVPRFAPAAKTELERSLADDLCSTAYEYRRIGHDKRVLSFSSNGAVDTGSADCERIWDISIVGDDAVLTISAFDKPTCQLVRSGDGSWGGLWTRHERMPVRLIPTETPAQRIAKSLVSAPMEYRRVGYDRRNMRFQQNGTIGEGAARCERHWKIVGDGESAELQISNGEEITCRLQLQHDGTWRGRWEKHEKMPVVIRQRKPLPFKTDGMGIISAALAWLANTRPHVHFVQIGAAQGHGNDPMRKYIDSEQWTGICVDPELEAYRLLTAKYDGAPRIKVESYAIAATTGERPFFYIDGAHPNDHFDVRRLGSLSLDVLQKHRHGVPDFDNRLRTTNIPCLSWASFLAKHGICTTDVLCIDTEGHDSVILSQIDLTAFRPTLLIYEHMHLTPNEKEAVCNACENAGYILFEDGGDTMGLLLP